MGIARLAAAWKVGVKDWKAVAVRVTKLPESSRGKLCPKGLSEHHTLTAPGRARQPLLRKQGKLVPVSWDEALDTMVERFGSIQQKYGKQSLGVIGTGQLVTEEFYTLGKLVQLGFGTSNFDGNTTLCMASAVHPATNCRLAATALPGSYARPWKLPM